MLQHETVSWTRQLMPWEIKQLGNTVAVEKKKMMTIMED
jgi:hypothetical protein